ncbi:hypothetical protein PGB90_000973 [Kerria lacca]
MKSKNTKYMKPPNSDDCNVMKEEILNFDHIPGSTTCYSEDEIPMKIFNNNVKTVDFVLVYDNKPSRRSPRRFVFDNDSKNKIRNIFENNLVQEAGLKLDKEIVNHLTFVKIHAPVPVLKKYCEILKFKMPLKETKEEQDGLMSNFSFLWKIKYYFKKIIRTVVTIDPRKHYQEETKLHAEYSADKFYLFDEESPNFFTPTIRILVTDFILNRTKWSENESDLHSVGIQTLIDNDVYKTAYPIHDGSYTENGSLRNRLYSEWADLNKWIRLQPTDDIKNYLGVKFAFYFAWLGFYTQLLIPATFFGLIVVIYGIISSPSQDQSSSFICNNGSGFIMCPLCDKNCDYWKLSDTCTSSKITYLFDNKLSVVFAFLMSVWATFFLELWKRHAAVLSHCWGLSDYTSQSEHPRPQFLAKLAGSKKMRRNVETEQVEPVLSFWFYKLPTVVFSYTVVIFFILIAFAAVFSIVLYRMWISNVHSWVQTSEWTKKYSFIIVPSTAGVLNLISIMLLNSVYNKIANYLTSLELPRTQTEFDNSLSIKLYIFQFVNYYASIMYIAFFKGKFVGYPKKYNKILGFRQEECTGGGCLTELSIQLGIIMVGQQIFQSILEIVVPAIQNWFNNYSLNKKDSVDNINTCDKKQWVEDYKLMDWSKQGLFSEYLEIAMQYGFVTLFACAFPIAPLFALVNNIFELRLDAQKILKYYKRPVPYQVPNIGAAIIAFSSNFIPELIYNLDERNISFVEFSTSSFRTADFPREVAPLFPSVNVSSCRYFGYRDPINYKHTVLYWKILTTRLLFMFIFQNAVFIIKTGAQWLIPDVPQKLTDRMRKEARLITELLIKRETELALCNAESAAMNKSLQKLRLPEMELLLENTN